MKKKLLFLLILLGSIESSFSQEVIDLFILAGQSNAQGWKGDAASYPTDTNTLDSSIRLNYTAVNIPNPGGAAGTYTSSSDGWTTMGPQIGLFPAGHFGPEVTFSRKLKQAGYNPAIFKFCDGDSSLYADWLAPGQSGGYDTMITSLNAAITLLQNQGHTVNIKGFIWIQGESDADNNTNANAYEERLFNLIKDVRTNVVNNSILPVVLGVDEGHTNIQNRGQVLTAQKDIAIGDSKIEFTSMIGLPKADGTHLTPAGIETQGVRVFDSYILALNAVPSTGCSITADGTEISYQQKRSWGQSFRSKCTGPLTSVTFNSADAITSGVTLSIKDGTDCAANTLYTQSVGAIVNGDNTVNLSSNLILTKEKKYYIHILSTTGDTFRIRHNATNQVSGNLKTYFGDTNDGSACDWDLPLYDMNFSVVVTDNTLNTKVQTLDNSVKIFPNPNKGIVNVYLNELKDVSIKVFTISGELIYHKNKINSSIYQFELKNSKPGIYIVQVYANEQEQKYKLIIK